MAKNKIIEQANIKIVDWGNNEMVERDYDNPAGCLPDQVIITGFQGVGVHGKHENTYGENDKYDKHDHKYKEEYENKYDIYGEYDNDKHGNKYEKQENKYDKRKKYDNKCGKYGEA